jgi:uncharacterized membrane protein (UPF0127 family)
VIARLLVSVLIVAAASQCHRGDDGIVETPTEPARPAVVLANGATILVEISADEATRQQGLMFRESLAPGHGMLFLFPQNGVHSFWMKNTLIPLDMIWIDESRRVVHVEQNVPPCRADPCPSYGPGTPSRFVLEVAAGQAAVHKVRAGDQLQFLNIDVSIAR